MLKGKHAVPTPLVPSVSLSILLPLWRGPAGHLCRELLQLHELLKLIKKAKGVGGSRSSR